MKDWIKQVYIDALYFNADLKYVLLERPTNAFAYSIQEYIDKIHETKIHNGPMI